MRQYQCIRIAFRLDGKRGSVNFRLESVTNPIINFIVYIHFGMERKRKQIARPSNLFFSLFLSYLPQIRLGFSSG